MTAREISKPAAALRFRGAGEGPVRLQTSPDAEDVSEMLRDRTSHVRHLNKGTIWIYHHMAPNMAPWEKPGIQTVP